MHACVYVCNVRVQCNVMYERHACMYACIWAMHSCMHACMYVMYACHVMQCMYVMHVSHVKQCDVMRCGAILGSVKYNM